MKSYAQPFYKLLYPVILKQNYDRFKLSLATLPRVDAVCVSESRGENRHTMH